MPDGGVSWLHSAGLEAEGAGIVSFSANNFSYIHHLSNGLSDDTVAHYITHTTYSYDSIIIHAFLVVIELQM
jgi:hypothetical protein